jgi:hypothetical protein
MLSPIITTVSPSRKKNSSARADGATAADANTKIKSEPTVDNRFLCMTRLASRIPAGKQLTEPRIINNFDVKTPERVGSSDPRFLVSVFSGSHSGVVK